MKSIILISKKNHISLSKFLVRYDSKNAIYVRSLFYVALNICIECQHFPKKHIQNSHQMASYATQRVLTEIAILSMTINWQPTYKK